MSLSTKGSEAGCTAPSRILSVDALRGFDMLWILGLSEVVRQILNSLFPGASSVEWITGQLRHVSWEGFVFYDLIFPLFLFLSGLSMAIALPRRVEREGLGAARLHLLQRALVLFCLGVFYNGGLMAGWDQIRWMGVLQRIGIASAVAGWISLECPSSKKLGVVALTILAVYAMPFYLVSVPGAGVTGFAMGDNIANYLDSVLLPGRLSQKTWDPEGILSTLPAVASAMIGVIAGRWLNSASLPERKVKWLFLSGLGAVLMGYALHPVLPIIKKIWTPTFVLVSSGFSAVLLSFFYWGVDVRGWRFWCPPFLWIGANPIAFYLLINLQVFHRISERLISKSFFSGQAWVPPLVTLGVVLFFARWMYRNKIHVRF